MALKKTRFIKGIILAPDDVAIESIPGELKVDSADSYKIKAYLDGASREIVTNSQSQVLTNKTLTSPVINTGVSGTAIDLDGTLAANSDSLLSSQKAIKTYVDAQIGQKDQANEILTNPSISGTVGETVQVVLQEHEDRLDDLVTLSGVAANAENLGTFTGTTIPDSSTVKAALQALETAHEEVDQNVNDLITLSGVAENSTTLGTFTGTTIPDSSTIKGALQSIETSYESHVSATSTHGVTGSIVGTSDNQTLTTKTINADNNTISNLQVSNLKAGVLDTDLTSVSASDDTLPSAKAVKTYADSLVPAFVSNQVSFTIANNQSSAANITGLIFSPATYRSAKVEYAIYRQTDDALTGVAQVGQLRLVYNSQQASWLLSDDYAGQSSGVEFSITALGQVQYTSSDLGAGTNYVGSLKYSIIKTFGV
jgi:hypothetical protein